MAPVHATGRPRSAANTAPRPPSQKAGRKLPAWRSRLEETLVETADKAVFARAKKRAWRPYVQSLPLPAGGISRRAEPMAQPWTAHIGECPEERAAIPAPAIRPASALRTIIHAVRSCCRCAPRCRQDASWPGRSLRLPWQRQRTRKSPERSHKACSQSFRKRLGSVVDRANLGTMVRKPERRALRNAAT